MAFFEWYQAHKENAQTFWSSDNSVFSGLVSAKGHPQNRPLFEWAQLAIDLINGLSLKQYREGRPVYRSFVVPVEQFVEASGIPPAYASWATVCVRNHLRSDGFDDVLVWSADHTVPLMGEVPLETYTDAMREAIHEHFHLTLEHYASFPSDKAYPFMEGLVEYVPRVRFGLQAQMPQSTEFLMHLPEEELLTARQMWHGLSRYSSEPIRQNRAYASCFLLGMGLVNRIMERQDCGMDEALSFYIGAFQSPTPEACIERLAEYGGMDPQLLMDSKQLQMHAQGYLEKYTCDNALIAVVERPQVLRQ